MVIGKTNISKQPSLQPGNLYQIRDMQNKILKVIDLKQENCKE